MSFSATQPAGVVIDGRFRLTGELGRGGMGVVFSAWDLAAQRPVALKAVLSDQLDPQRRERFRREGELTASIQHPHVLRVYAAGEHQGRPYIAYELVEGARTFAQAAAGAPREQRVRWVRDAAAALGAAHAQGVVHRDVKPDNLLVDAAGHLRVADFGLALAQDAEKLTRTGAVLGTPQFMAPELFAGKGFGEVGPPSDVWALGVLLYQALSGELPFTGVNLYELAAQVAQAEIPPLRQHDPTIPAELEAICAKALQRQARERYPDGQALAEDLERHLRGEGVSASGVRYLRPGARRRAGWMALGCLVALALGLALLWDPSGRVPSELDRRQQAVEAAQSPASPPPAASPASPSPSATPDEVEQGKPKQGPTLDQVVDFIGGSLARVETDNPGVVDYQTGELFRKSNDWTEAYRWYRKAAERGHVRAMRKLAEGYLKAKGVGRDVQEGARWLALAAQRGSADSAYDLAVLMLTKELGAVDGKRALKLLLLAADGGNHKAESWLARLYAQGAPGVPQDPTAAANWQARVDARERKQARRQSSD
ncbi:MAG: serine/threonine-protein kinase [Planctomycetota bacterium]